MFLKIDTNSSKENNLIHSIQAIQLSNFKPGDIRNLSTDEFIALKALVIKIGNKLIKANLEKEGRLNYYLSAKKDFAIIIHKLSQPVNKLCFIRYAAQLIQYYTLLSDLRCSHQSDLQDFRLFLDRKNVVNPDMNLYIIEHQILIIYKELFNIEEAVGRSILRAALEAKLELINLHLEKLRDIIDGGKIDAPYNVFIFYLGFVLNHSFLRALELYDSLQLSAPGQSKISELKDVYKELANEDLNAINTIRSECLQNEISYANGSEFSLGEDIYRKLGMYTEKYNDRLSVCSKL